MISKTIGFRGTLFSDTPMYVLVPPKNTLDADLHREKHMFGDGPPGMSVQFLPIYSLLLALYLGGAGYYRCGDVLGDSSLAHFSGLDAVLALCWSAWILLGMRWLRDVPKPHRTTMASSWLSTLSLPGARKDPASRLGKFFWFILWPSIC